MKKVWLVCYTYADRSHNIVIDMFSTRAKARKRRAKLKDYYRIIGVEVK